jgi:hopanoid biosynthesis associated RND transporter like protein HpnN
MNPESPPSPETALVPQLLVRLVSAVCRVPRLVLAVSLLACVASLYVAATRLEYHTQRTDLISPQKDYQQRWKKYLAEFGDDDDIVVVVQGEDRARMQQALDALAGRVAAQPQLFDRLFYKVNLQSLRDRALLFLPVPEIESIRDNLRSMGLLLNLGQLGWRQLSLHSLLGEAQGRIRAMSPGQELSASDEQFFGQLVAVTRSAATTLAEPTAYRNPWGSLMSRPPEQKDLLAQPQYFFSGDGTLAFLLARPVKEAGSFTAAQRSVGAMQDIVAQTRSEFPGIAFGLTGLPVLETDEMVAAEHDTKLASWLALGGVALLFFLVYRSVYYPLLTIVALLTGTIWAMGWTTVTVGHLNILSATFAVMLIGMGDYGVLWVMRYEQARRLGFGVPEALKHTAIHVAVGNLTAAATLALAFFAAMLADFKAVAELGWIAGCGVLLCAFACFTLLPALLMVFDRRSQPISETIPITTQSGWRPLLAERPRWVIAAGALLTLVLAICAGVWNSYDHNLLHMQARDLDSVKWELTLIEHTAGASWHALSYTDTPEEARALKAKYEKLPEVSRVVEIASLVPGQQTQKIELMRDIQRRLRSLPERGAVIAHERPDVDDVKYEIVAVVPRLETLAQGVPLLRDLQSNLLKLWAQLDRMDVKTAPGRLQDFDQRLAGSLAEDLHQLRDVSRPAPIILADLPGDLRERFVGKNGKWLVQAFAKDCLWDFAPLEHFTKQIRTVDPEATGKTFGTVEGLKAMKSGLEWAGVYALIAIIVVLSLDFRRMRHVLIALTPLAMGVIISLGIMSLFRLPLNPANVIAFPLILGVGVDNGVHILHDWLLRRKEGRATLSYPIGRGVLVKALTTLIGFGTLMISSQRGLAGLGFILTLGVGCCMVTALVFLPAVLRLWTERKMAESETLSVALRRSA